MIRSLLPSGSPDKTLEFLPICVFAHPAWHCVGCILFSSSLLSLGAGRGGARDAGCVAVPASMSHKRVFCANGEFCICFPADGYLFGLFQLLLTKNSKNSADSCSEPGVQVSLGFTRKSRVAGSWGIVCISIYQIIPSRLPIIPPTRWALALDVCPLPPVGPPNCQMS